MHLAEIIWKKDGSISDISIVNKPAIEIGVIKLNNEKEIKLSIDEDQQIITGPVLIPDRKYWRNSDFFGKDDEGGYIYFSKETIKNIAIDYLNNANNAISLEHDELVKKGDVKLLEMWFVENENDKAYNYYSKDEITTGSLMMSQKIENDSLWKDVKEGKYNGFSITGKLSFNLLMNKEYNNDEIADIIVDLIREHLHN